MITTMGMKFEVISSGLYTEMCKEFEQQKTNLAAAIHSMECMLRDHTEPLSELDRESIRDSLHEYQDTYEALLTAAKSLKSWLSPAVSYEALRTQFYHFLSSELQAKIDLLKYPL